MNTNKLKYIHGALVMAQSKAEGREIEIMKSAIMMIEKELEPQIMPFSPETNELIEKTRLLGESMTKSERY